MPQSRLLSPRVFLHANSYRQHYQNGKIPRNSQVDSFHFRLAISPESHRVVCNEDIAKRIDRQASKSNVGGSTIHTLGRVNADKGRQVRTVRPGWLMQPAPTLGRFQSLIIQHNDRVKYRCTEYEITIRLGRDSKSIAGRRVRICTKVGGRPLVAVY